MWSANALRRSTTSYLVAITTGFTLKRQFLEVPAKKNTSSRDLLWFNPYIPDRRGLFLTIFSWPGHNCEYYFFIKTEMCTASLCCDSPRNVKRLRYAVISRMNTPACAKQLELTTW